MESRRNLQEEREMEGKQSKRRARAGEMRTLVSGGEKKKNKGR